MVLEPLGVVFDRLRRAQLKGGVGQVERTVPQVRCLARCAQRDAWQLQTHPWVRQWASDRGPTDLLLSRPLWTASDPPCVESNGESEARVRRAWAVARQRSLWFKRDAWQCSSGYGQASDPASDCPTAPCQWVRWSLMWPDGSISWGFYLSPMAGSCSLS
jgi:hypothetical protein